MNAITETQVDRIRTLAAELDTLGRTALEKAAEAGRLLIDCKAQLKHGEWLPWLESNFTFTDRTARNYMKIAEAQESGKLETVSDLSEAYRITTETRQTEDAALLMDDGDILKAAKNITNKRREIAREQQAQNLVSMSPRNIGDYKPECFGDRELKVFFKQDSDKRLFLLAIGPNYESTAIEDATFIVSDDTPNDLFNKDRDTKTIFHHVLEYAAQGYLTCTEAGLWCNCMNPKTNKWMDGHFVHRAQIPITGWMKTGNQHGFDQRDFKADLSIINTDGMTERERTERSLNQIRASLSRKAEAFEKESIKANLEIEKLLNKINSDEEAAVA